MADHDLTILTADACRKTTRSMRVRTGLLASSMLAMALTCSPAFAAEGDDAGAPPAAEGNTDAGSTTQGGDIVVTATRRSERMRDIPISIAALSSESLEKKGIRGIQDLVTSIPGISMSQGWGASTNISIRGIYSAVGAATTGVYINDVPIMTRSLGASGTFTNTYPAIFDLDRVEALKGPQGTLFGAGSEGGTIRFITPAPSLTETSGYARAEAGITEGGAPSYEMGAAIGVPLIEDKLGLRVSAYRRHDGGYIDRDPYPSGTSVKNSNYTNTTALQAALKFQATDAVSITPSVFFQRQYRADANTYWPDLSDVDGGQFVSGQVVAQPEADQFVIAANKVEVDLGFATLISDTSFLSRNDKSVGDYSNFGAELLGLDYRAGVELGLSSWTNILNRQRSFTQEVRLQSNGGPGASVNWTLGVFYQNARQTASHDYRSPDLDVLTQSAFGMSVEDVFGYPLTDGDGAYNGYATSRDRQLAVFGEVEYKPVDGLSITVGARLARVQADATNYAYGPFNGGTSYSESSAKQTPFTPKATLSYKVTPDLMLYASASKGFRVGGGNPKVNATALCQAGLANLGLSEAPSSYKSDTLWNYEVGAKGSALSDLVTFSGSAFLINWNDIQNDVNLDCGNNFVANLGKARSKGVDLQVTVSPTYGLSLSAAVAYTDARYTTSVTANSSSYITLAGQRLFVSPWSMQLSGDYHFEMPDSHVEPYVHADYNYASGFDFSQPLLVGYDASDYHSYARQITNMRVGARVDEMDISLYVNNLFNSRDLLNSHHNLSSSALFRNSTYRPRSYGITASYRF